MNQYGINIDTLDTFMGKPAGPVLLEDPAFRLERLVLQKDKEVELPGDAVFEATLWLEEGEAIVGDVEMKAQEAIALPPQKKCKVHAKTAMVAYLFFGAPDKASEYFKKSTSFDKRDKYWGTIESIVSKDYAAKRMLVRKGTQASLEYHCRKVEGYYIHSGKLLLRLRAGRGEDRFFELETGRTAFIPPGLMHQRGGLEDTVIIEISTRDEDSDSFLVEDGQAVPMPRLTDLLVPRANGKKTVCVDLDGCICTATEGEYEKAEPTQEAIRLVNKLFDEGHRIIIYTARFMGRAKNVVSDAQAQGYVFTKKQLAAWGVKYHELVMGKPPADIYIDDRAIFFANDWKKIEAEVKKQL